MVHELGTAGGLGGEVIGRRRAYVADGDTRQLDSLNDANRFLSSLPAPAPDIEGIHS